MSWKQQKILSLVAIAAALVINCWPLHPSQPAPANIVSAAP
jgi:hypothetical protein